MKAASAALSFHISTLVIHPMPRLSTTDAAYDALKTKIELLSSIASELTAKTIVCFAQRQYLFARPRINESISTKHDARSQSNRMELLDENTAVF
jgi:hypothetical protein